MLAPEEMFAPPSASSLVARSELDPEQKRKARQKARKEKMHLRQGLDAAVDKFAGKGGGGGKARGGVKAQKDKALQELVKTGKGVSRATIPACGCDVVLISRFWVAPGNGHRQRLYQEAGWQGARGVGCPGFQAQALIVSGMRFAGWRFLYPYGVVYDGYSISCCSRRSL
jgi:hypothetical protein